MTFGVVIADKVLPPVAHALLSQLTIKGSPVVLAGIRPVAKKVFRFFLVQVLTRYRINFSRASIGRHS